MRQDFDQSWGGALSAMADGMKAWRLEYPHATMEEIERESERRLAKLQARMVADMALASEAADVPAAKARGAAAVRCPQCGGAMRARGKRSRKLTGAHNQTIELQRTYLECPACKTGFFPPG